MKVLQLITARAGSKGCKNKNIREIEGLPLIAFKAISAKKSDYCDRLILSTDSDVFRDIGRQYDAEAPFLRPEYLATDTASSIDVINHALEWLEVNDGQSFDYVSLLEPASPFATYKQINEAMTMLIEKKADSVLGMTAVKTNSIFVNELGMDGSMRNFYNKIYNETDIRRQNYNMQYTMNGSIYIFNVDRFKQTGQIIMENSYGYIMDEYYGYEIDQEIEFEFGRMLVEKGHVDMSYWR